MILNEAQSANNWEKIGAFKERKRINEIIDDEILKEAREVNEKTNRDWSIVMELQYLKALMEKENERA
jgi:hypothetical protein